MEELNLQLRNFTPGEIISTLQRDYPNVNLKHLQSRRLAGVLQPSINSPKKGSKNYYSLDAILIYIIAINLETLNFDIKEAGLMAAAIIFNEFHNRDSMWILKFYGEKPGSTIFLPKGAQETIWMRPELLEELKEMNVEPCFLNPLPHVYFYFQKDYLENITTALTKIVKIEFADVTSMIQNAIRYLKLTEEEIQFFHYSAIKDFDKGDNSRFAIFKNNFLKMNEQK